MNVEIKDLITLSDGNKYVVCSKVNYQEKNYLYLIDIDNIENIKFGIVKQRENKKFITEIKNDELIRQLLSLFYNEAKHIINVEEF